MSAVGYPQDSNYKLRDSDEAQAQVVLKIYAYNIDLKICS